MLATWRQSCAAAQALAVDGDMPQAALDGHQDTECRRQILCGNGLKNIASRMKNIGGTYSIKNNNGTETILEFPL